MREAWLLFGGLFAVLALASLVAALLKRRAADPGSAGLVNLSQRINAWWVMVIVIGVAFLLGRAGVVVLFALISFAALREFVTLTRTSRADHRVLLAMFAVVLPVQFWLVWSAWYGLFAIFIPVYCFLLMPALTAMHGDTANFLERVSAQQWALTLSVYCISHVPALLTLPVPGFNDAPETRARGLLLVAFLLIVVQGSDVLQYVFGKLFGRRRLAPVVSPSKTWEGLVGGLVSASALGAALFWLTPFTPLQAAAAAFAACLMGFFGGLVASAIKRDQGVKDWGHLIEGHGGMLDRADSLVFAAPVFFHIVRFWWTA